MWSDTLKYSAAHRLVRNKPHAVLAFCFPVGTLGTIPISVMLLKMNQIYM